MVNPIQTNTLLTWAQLTPSEMRWHQAAQLSHAVCSALLMASNLMLASKVLGALSLPTISILAGLSLTTVLTAFVGAFVLNGITAAFVAKDAHWVEQLARERGPQEIRPTGDVAIQWSASLKMRKIFELIPEVSDFLVDSLIELSKPEQAATEAATDEAADQSESAAPAMAAVDVGPPPKGARDYGMKFVAAFKAAYAELTSSEKASLPEDLKEALESLSNLLNNLSSPNDPLKKALGDCFNALQGALESTEKSVGFTLFPEDIEQLGGFVEAEGQAVRQLLGLSKEATDKDIEKVNRTLDPSSTAYFGCDTAHLYVNSYTALRGLLDRVVENHPGELANGSPITVSQLFLDHIKQYAFFVVRAKVAAGLTPHLKGPIKAPKLFFGQVADLRPVAPEVASGLPSAPDSDGEEMA